MHKTMQTKMLLSLIGICLAVMTYAQQGNGRSNNVVLNSNGVSSIMWPFRYHKNTMTEICGSDYHVGEDYYSEDWRRSAGSAASCGSYLYAPISGYVIFDGVFAGYGRQIIIQSNTNSGFAVRLAHLQSAVNFSPGQYVNAGQYVGRLGTSGTNNCHLHVVLYKNLNSWNIRNLQNGWSANWQYQDFNLAARFNMDVSNPYYEGRASTCFAGPGSPGMGRSMDISKHDDEVIMENELLVTPNPVNYVSYINYTLVEDVEVSLTLIDISGRVIRNILNQEQKEAGHYQIAFEKEDLDSGIYFLKMESKSSVLTQKVVIE